MVRLLWLTISSVNSCRYVVRGNLIRVYKYAFLIKFHPLFCLTQLFYLIITYSCIDGAFNDVMYVLVHKQEGKQ